MKRGFEPTHNRLRSAGKPLLLLIMDIPIYQVPVCIFSPMIRGSELTHIRLKSGHSIN